MSEDKSLPRLEAFSDGVFAIAITLLILEIRVPPIHSIHSVDDLINALIQLWPSFFAFTYAFGTTLVQWIFHHNLCNLLNRTSRAFLYANGFLLLTIVLFPFLAALLAEYINTDYVMPAIVCYGIVSVINSFAWFLFYQSMDKPIRLRSSSFSDEILKKIKRSNRFALAIYASSTLLSIWLPYIGLLINIALWLIWISLSLAGKEK